MIIIIKFNIYAGILYLQCITYNKSIIVSTENIAMENFLYRMLIN